MTYSIDDFFAAKPDVERIKEEPLNGFALQDRRVGLCARLLSPADERIGH
ncbi:MAG TPA: hypothetical protein VMS92_11355 [Mycobacterium sp.]|nr:hypothetical protein [Mycobacterium sp.]